MFKFDFASNVLSFKSIRYSLIQLFYEYEPYISNYKNRLLKVCYVPATRAGLPKLFLLQPLTVLMKQTRQAVCTIKQSILLSCLWYEHHSNISNSAFIKRCVINVVKFNFASNVLSFNRQWTLSNLSWPQRWISFKKLCDRILSICNKCCQI